MRLGQHIKLLEENQIEGTAIILSHCQKISLILYRYINQNYSRDNNIPLRPHELKMNLL